MGGLTAQAGKAASRDALDSAAEALDVGLWAVASAIRTVKIRGVNESILFVMDESAMMWRDR